MCELMFYISCSRKINFLTFNMSSSGGRVEEAESGLLYVDLSPWVIHIFLVE